MENQKTLLSELRLRSAIDCDTLDVEGMLCIELRTRVFPDLILPTVAQALGPFVDCTSNQVS